jgi:hypothetical protein
MSDRGRYLWWEWAAAIALLLVACWFRGNRLADVPPGLHHDDIKNILLVEKIVDGDLRIYYEENFGHEPLYHWLQAIYALIVGLDYPEVRLLSIGISIAGLALIYALVRQALGRQVALWTLAWQAVSLWPLFYSRRAIRGVLLPPLAALSAYLFLRGLNEPDRTGRERWAVWALGGLSLAGCLYTYMASRVLPVFFVLLIAYLALCHRCRLAAHWRGIALFVVVAVVVSLPLIHYLATHPEERMGQINMPLDAARRGEWKPLLENSLRALGMFTFVGDPHWRQFVADTPVFVLAGALLFYGGILICVWQWRQLEYAIWVPWLLVALSPAMLSEGAPNFLRPIAVQVAVYVFPALAMHKVVCWGRRRWGQRVGWAGIVIGVLVLAGEGARTAEGYFVRWPQHPDVRFAYNSTLLDESRYLDRTPRIEHVVLSGHFSADLDPALVERYLERRDLVIRWCDVRQSLVFPSGGAGVVLRPDYFPIDLTLSALFIEQDTPLYQEFLADGTLAFAVWSLSVERLEAELAVMEAGPVGWSNALTFADGLADDWQALDRPIVFDDRIALLGYQILGGASAAAPGPVDLLTAWRVVRPGPRTAVMFVHVLGPDGSVVSGADSLGAPANRWIERDVIVQLHRLPLGDDLAAGGYPIEVGWYEADTGARWQVQVGSEMWVDRLLLSSLQVASEMQRGE